VSVIGPAYTKTASNANFMQPDATLDAYHEAREGVTKRVNEVMATAERPGVVAETVLKAANAAHPKIRYAAGKLANCLRLLADLRPLLAWWMPGFERIFSLTTTVASQPPCRASVLTAYAPMQAPLPSHLLKNLGQRRKRRHLSLSVTSVRIRSRLVRAS
jgi:hypothetical protein